MNVALGTMGTVFGSPFGAAHLVRLGLDGDIQTIDEAPGAPEDSPFHFAAHP